MTDGIRPNIPILLTVATKKQDKHKRENIYVTPWTIMANLKIKRRKCKAHKLCEFTVFPGKFGESVHCPVIELLRGHAASIIQNNHCRFPKSFIK